MKTRTEFTISILCIGAIAASLFLVATAKAATTAQIFNGGTGTSTAPSYGQVLIGGKNGEYELVATSTFSAGSGAVQSVFGRTGVVTAQSGDYSTSLVTEGSNLYYTLARWAAAFAGTTTNALTEGSNNLYFTNARSDTRFITDLAATTSVKSITTLPSLSLPYAQLSGAPTALSAFTNDVGYMLTSAFNGLFDARLAATTSLPNITTLSSLSLPYSQVTGKPTALSAFTNDVGFVTSSFSTTSANFWSSLGLGFSTTSTNYWFTQQPTSPSFSTTSAAYFSSIGLAFSTTSANYNFNTNLAATTSVKSITTLASLSLPYSQLTGTPATGVSSVFTRTGAVTAQSGDYTTTQVTEGTNLYYTTTRFDNRLSATTSLPNITTLAGLSLPYSQLTGTPAILPYPFPGGATSSLVTFSGGLTASNNVTLSGITGSTQCLHVSTSGVISGTGSDCGSAGGTVTTVTATYPILSSGGTSPVISTAFGTTTSWGIGNNGFLVTGATGIPLAVASSSLRLPTSALASQNISQFTNDSGFVTASFSTTSATYFSSLGLAFSTTSDAYDFNVLLTGTTSLPRITTLSSLSLPYSQLTGTPSILPYPFPGGATTTNVTFSNGLTGNVTGSATTLATARTLSITGDLPYTSPAFDGSGNVTAAGTLATVNANVGSFTNANITVNAKGLITAASNGSGSGSPFPFTPSAAGNATGTTLILNNGFISNASSTLSANLQVGASSIVGNGSDSITLNGASGFTLLNGNNGWGINAQSDWLRLVAGGSGQTQLQWTTDTGLSRLSAGVLTLGNGTYQDTTGGLIAGSSTISNGLFSTANPLKDGTLSGLIAGNSGLTYAIATTTASCSGTASCSSFTVIGSTPVTITGSGGSSVAGSNGQIQYNKFGAFGADGFFTIATTTGIATLTVGQTNSSFDTGKIALSYSGSVTDSTITLAAQGGTSGAKTITVPNANGTLAVSASGSGIALDSAGNLTNTGVTSIVAGTNVTISGATGAVTINASGGGATFGYPFALAGNATSTLTQFNGGLTAFATSTIGDGTRPGGLTISGGATTTGNAYFGGQVGIGVQPAVAFDVLGTLRDANTTTDATNKQFVFTDRNFTNSQNDFLLFEGQSKTSGNVLLIGGGITGFTAASTIAFFAGTGNNTDTGTSEVTISTNGLTVATLSNGIVKSTAGLLSNATPGTDYDVFGYPFPASATTSVVSFGSGLISLGSTTFGSNVNFTALANGSINISNHAAYSTGTSTPGVSAPIGYSGTLGQFIGGASGNFTCTTASAGVTGCLLGTDWSTFNGKQAAGNYVTALTGDVTASGPGSAGATLATVNGNVGSFTNANVTVNAKGLVTAVSNGSAGGSTFPFTPQALGNATGTLLLLNGGIISNASSTIGNGTATGGLTISGNATTTGNIAFPNGTFAIVENGIDNAFAIGTSTANPPILSVSTRNSPAGLVGIGSSTPWGKLSVEMGALSPAFVVSNFGSTSAAFIVTGVNGNGNVGVGTSTPIATFSVQANQSSQVADFATTNGTSIFHINSGGNVGLSTSSPFAQFTVVGGSILATENKLATSTSMTVDFKAGTNQLMQTGTGATTIAFTNKYPGAHLLLTVCNPGAAAGAITWSGVEWPGGTVPTQTTTANVCDIWSFTVSQATSTSVGSNKIFGAASLNYP